jgi:uncharacterized phage protein (TIGR01671 family)
MGLKYLKNNIMNSKIKCRAWVSTDGGENKMIDYVCFLNPQDNQVYGLELSTEYNLCTTLDVMPFTTLQDKNGKEVYEKDIVAIDDLVLGYVIFDNGCFQIKDINSTQGTNLFNQERAQRVQVIGNIYENPELLK